MARPRKCRRVCSLPQNMGFAPIAGGGNSRRVVMTVDEYETIRLIDWLGYTQEECADQMHIARTTVQGMYNTARKKLADAVVNGKSLFIAGGDFILCDEEMPCMRKCGRDCCKGTSQNTMQGEIKDE